MVCYSRLKSRTPSTHSEYCECLECEDPIWYEHTFETMDECFNKLRNDMDKHYNDDGLMGMLYKFIKDKKGMIPFFFPELIPYEYDEMYILEETNFVIIYQRSD